MKFLFYTVYNLLILMAIPVAWVVAFFNDKFGGSLTGQKQIIPAVNLFNSKVKKDPKPVIWTHAASAGEYEQMRPILTRLQDMDVYVFQTFTSATIYYKSSQDKLFDGVSFLPWDIYTRVNHFIKLLQPNLFINTRHDIWPNLLLSLHYNRVRNILINANLYRESKRLYPIIRGVNRIVFRNIDHIYTGSDSLQLLLNQLYDGPISVVGDSRFDQVIERSYTNQSVLIPGDIITDRKVIVYGSVGNTDLSIITGAISKAITDNDLLHIIVPHEVKERDLIPWEVQLFRHKIKSIRKSELSEYKNESVILWNSVGQLADLYKYAHLAYIGAGFGDGVHSVTEAAIYHVPASHGPKYDILAEAIDLVEEGLSKVTHHEDELYDFLTMPLATRSDMSQQIKLFVNARLGATDAIIKHEFPLKDSDSQ